MTESMGSEKQLTSRLSNFLFTITREVNQFSSTTCIFIKFQNQAKVFQGSEISSTFLPALVELVEQTL